MYRVIVERRATKETERYPANDLKKILEAIAQLSSEPRPPGAKKPTDQEGYRIRVGEYRILYYVVDGQKVVIVYRIKRRGESTYCSFKIEFEGIP